jgi:hypothetical protein
LVPLQTVWIEGINPQTAAAGSVGQAELQALYHVQLGPSN